MPLPTWYRVMRALPGVLAGSLFVGIGLYLALAPTSYRDPNNPKMVAYANSMHPVVILMGVAAVLGGLVLLFFGARLFFRLPASLREYTYEQLRLGRMLAREIIRLTPDEPHYRSVEYDGGGKISSLVRQLQNSLTIPTGQRRIECFQSCGSWLILAEPCRKRKVFYRPATMLMKILTIE